MLDVTVFMRTADDLRLGVNVYVVMGFTNHCAAHRKLFLFWTLLLALASDFPTSIKRCHGYWIRQIIIVLENFVAGTCEYGNELSGSIKCGEFLD